MRPMTPVIPGMEERETVFAKNQPPYLPLAALPVKDGIVTRWRMSWKERLQALWHGDVYLWIKTFGKPLQPVMLRTERPTVTPTVGPAV